MKRKYLKRLVISKILKCFNCILHKLILRNISSSGLSWARTSTKSWYKYATQIGSVIQRSCLFFVLLVLLKIIKYWFSHLNDGLYEFLLESHLGNYIKKKWTCCCMYFEAKAFFWLCIKIIYFRNNCINFLQITNFIQNIVRN